jgi:phenylacetate-CoA ligase
VPPRAVICTAEALLPHQRTLVEQVLRAPVFEQYGCREFGMVAAECPAHQGMHVATSAAYIEYRAISASADAPYEMLVTDLLNYGMPLIRYQINDCVAAPPAAAGRCACGRNLPRLPAIIGRTSDTLRLPDGSLMPGVALIAALAEGEALGSAAPRLDKAQIVQEDLGQFRLRYVPGAGFTSAQLEPLRRKLDAILGTEIHWEFEAVAEIAREASGKTRFCVSKVGAAKAGPRQGS